MTEAVVASRKPFLVELSAGRKYFWCACGRSRRQPYCDGSHAGTGIEPVAFTPEAGGEAVLCGCKRTRRPPYCDGTHHSLADRYAEAGADEVGATAALPVTPRSDGRSGVAVLDGGCFVRTVDVTLLERHGSARLGRVISAADGARFLSQWYLVAAPGPSGVLSFPGSDTLVFLPAGDISITISGREFQAGSASGIYVRRGEAFQIFNPGGAPLALVLTVCPPCEAPRWPEAMWNNFDAGVARRVYTADSDGREHLADRYYQILIGEQHGSREVTQFIGEIPRSRAAAHRHLYEEAIMILAGRGWLWTESARAAVGPGDIIFLPRKQLHSLECTDTAGMRLVGVFYPAGSPAINY